MVRCLTFRILASHRPAVKRHVTSSIEVAQQRRCFTVLLEDDNDASSTDQQQVRLSKRMSELGICSRREAAAILKRANEQAANRDVSHLKHLKEVIYLRGQPVIDGTSVKVSPDERYIEIRAGDDPPTVTEGDDELKEFVPYEKRPYEDIMGDTIVLNKPSKSSFAVSILCTKSLCSYFSSSSWICEWAGGTSTCTRSTVIES